MTNDISQSIPQRKHRKDDAQDGRQAQISDLLRRSCQANDAQFKAGSANGGGLYEEQAVVERFIYNS